MVFVNYQGRVHFACLDRTYHFLILEIVSDTAGQAVCATTKNELIVVDNRGCIRYSHIVEDDDMTTLKEDDDAVHQKRLVFTSNLPPRNDDQL